MENSKVSLECMLLQLLENNNGSTTKELVSSANASSEEVEASLESLKHAGAVEARKVGNNFMWYALKQGEVKKVLIVEDDVNINKLIKISLGAGYEVKEAYDGRDALSIVKEFHPDLILLDLMLPGVNGLEVCKAVKKEFRDITVVIVSAADAARNRLVGLGLGADYYVKKPFDPKELRMLVKIFLKKKGKKFDPLVDLPDDKRLSAEIEGGLKAKENFEVNNLRIKGLNEFAEKFGEEKTRTIVRLVSQILQDKVREWDSKQGFIGYIGNGEFIVGGGKNETNMVISDTITEFEQVLPFVYQSEPAVKLDVEDLFGSKQADGLQLVYDSVPLENILKKREEINKTKRDNIGEYTYEELKQLVGSSNVSLNISRSASGEIKISMAKDK
ncbi:response regulator [Candidatus Micrarchaeota archaeon]|nr:response regulator [Candidatus Micrarchaeota archaeon]